MDIYKTLERFSSYVLCCYKHAYGYITIIWCFFWEDSSGTTKLNGCVTFSFLIISTLILIVLVLLYIPISREWFFYSLKVTRFCRFLNPKCSHFLLGKMESQNWFHLHLFNGQRCKKFFDDLLAICNVYFNWPFLMEFLIESVILWVLCMILFFPFYILGISLLSEE